MRRIIVVTLALLALAGCSKPADPDLAEQAVPQFHMALIDGDFDGIYSRAAGELKRSQSQQEFVRYLQAVRRTLGEVKGAERTATKVAGRLVTLTYTSNYANGLATEEFVIRADENQEPVLAGYRVLTPALK
ncbi:membrane lipoprotein lipid attachment site-containing protein [Uliginosibacterium sp. 31-16]|uniref:membrane lipoprotein lipid attachment site-containing protein n=1 Tax=Uliginosibacterium sp. 31-16 TaxID=3068315 RepID=UPI00273D1CDC|nr:membrane lipoprotein lipid attachment site-containing protein [Uliginosibacterium sp. 31-16]MDP5238400.1 membrane lipoprotein lipid attachment site-containing protein [Uliginosibacterium sp. 31-16]